ncbi:Uncharacterised protein [Mycobacteroides abscessus subsp. abscessus]|nr:Uncharacterised protein [Mycobacteroides abscessus subsp. abscessus]
MNMVKQAGLYRVCFFGLGRKRRLCMALDLEFLVAFLNRTSALHISLSSSGS